MNTNLSLLIRARLKVDKAGREHLTTLSMMTCVGDGRYLDQDLFLLERCGPLCYDLMALSTGVLGETFEL